MSSILRRTSRKNDDDRLIPSLPQRAPTATFPLLFDTASTTPMIIERGASRGVRLLIKAKQFHIARRGLKETSGFWYIAKHHRHARFLVAAEIRKWELENERIPPDELRFWKLTKDGGVHAITEPDALFVGRRKGQEEGAGEEPHHKHYHQQAGSKSTNTAHQPPHQQYKQQQEERGGLQTTGITVNSEPGPRTDTKHLKQARPGARGGAAGLGDTGDPVNGAPAPSSSITAVVDNKQANASRVDRFGRKKKVTDYVRWRKANTQDWPPSGDLVALGWGWGGEFRIGTGRDGFEVRPRPLHPDFKRKQLVDLAVGKRHSLFVSDDGLVFSVGEGLRWQLGTTSQFINRPVRPAVQRLPKQVHPSGNLKAGKDYWVAQAAAGDTFSMTREANWEDAARATEGFLWMKKAVKRLLEQSPSRGPLRELWEHMLEEERTLQRRFQGRLLSWGSGERGQLGLGEDVYDRKAPSVIHGLAGMPVRTVVAGAAHALCVTLDGKVFSWGSGQDGRLGHGDYKDRWEPCRVNGLGPVPVAMVAAGKAHSMAVALPQSVYVWGRGLGTGDNKCRHEPVRLKVWPSGFPGCVVKDIALGGAHSIVLAHRSLAPVTLANPWGVESLGYAWGYGYCGQLGLGLQAGEVTVPSRIAFDRKELITSVVAGKAFSLAANVQGQMFAWGKGWAGQLGLGIARDSRVAPTRVDFPGVGRHLFVKLAAGERHATALTLRCSPPPRGWDKDKQWEKVYRSHVGMKKWESGLLRLWRCPRRPPWTKRGPNREPLFACATCGMSCVCRTCARSCHGGHDIHPCTRKLRVLCECGLGPFRWGSGSTSSTSTSCANGIVGSSGAAGPRVVHKLAREEGGAASRSMTRRTVKAGAACWDATVQAATTQPALPLPLPLHVPVPLPAPCRLLVSVEDEEDAGNASSWLHHNATECQRLIRGWLGRRTARRRGEEKRRRRREAIEAVWYVTVLGAMERSILRFDKDQERERNREGMAAADLESAFYRYYSKLQPVIMVLNQQREALKDFSTREGVTFETPASASDPRVILGLAPREKITLWSRRAVRQLQRQLPPALRLTEERLVRMTAALPAGGDRPERPGRSAEARWGGRGGGVGDAGGGSGGSGVERARQEEESGRRGVEGRSYCGEAAGAGRLGGVPDPDVDALLRSSQPSRRRRTVDIAGPEGLYRRVTRMRSCQLQRLSSRRRASFSEGDLAACVDKSRTAEDLKWAHKLDRYWIGVDSSLGVTRYLQIGDRQFKKLADPQQLRWRRSARSLHKFLRNFGPGSVDPDVASMKERRRAGRAHSLCAPERVYAATVTWESRHRKLQGLLRASTKRGYPASGDGMKWTRRAERWGGLAPPPRNTAISTESLRRSAQRIVSRAAKRGLDLRPPTGQSRAGYSSSKLGGDLADTPGSAEAAMAAVSGSWQAYDDGNGNTYYVNDFTGESLWEIPTPAAAAAAAEEPEGFEEWDQATGQAMSSITAAAGEGETAAWWNGGGGEGWEHGLSDHVDDYECPAAETEARCNGRGDTATTGWELATQDQRSGQDEWTQEWDEGSQSYYWYNTRTGESRW